MDSSRPEPGPSWAFLWGKRRWRRQATLLPAEIVTSTRRIEAEAVNVSAGGALLRLPHRLGAFDIQNLLAPSFTLDLGRAAIRRTAEPIRVVWQPQESDAVYVGCRLREVLSPEDVRALDLEERVRVGEAGAQALTADMMPFQARRSARARFEVLTKLGQRVLHVGRLVAMNGRDFAFRVERAEPTGLIADLARERSRVRILKRGRAVWADHAWLLGIQLLPAGVSEVVMQAEQHPPRSVHRLFLRRTGGAASPHPDHASGA